MRRLRPEMIAVWLAAATAAAGSPFISEFMADNSRTLRDAFGAYADWIEISNPGPTPVNLEGWYLTDKIGKPTQWRFPAVTIGANTSLVVFASGRDTVTNGELHTNFQLSKDGDYLALVHSNGMTVVSAFAPEFPPQFEDVSYGTASAFSSVALVDAYSPCRAHVPPTNTTLGTAWRERTFSDTGWTTGRFAVGYFTNATPNLSAELGLDVRTNMYYLRPSVYIRAPFVVSSPASYTGLRLDIKFDDGFALFLNGQWVFSSNAPALASLNENSVSPYTHNPTAFESFLLDAALPHLVAGTNVLAIHALNRTTGSSDLFVQPRLLATLADTNAVTGYFASPTPGVLNGGNDTIRLPQTPAFSVAPGVFTNSFTLAITGGVEGLEVRYTTNATVPTAASALYTGPFTVGNSLHVRARFFAPNGQAGNTATAQYTFLDPSVRAFRSNLPLLILRNVDPGQPGPVLTALTNVSCYAQLVDPGTNAEVALSAPTVVNTRCGVNVRGKSSANFPKKSYAMEFWGEDDVDRKIGVLGLEAQSDWALIGCWSYDRTYFHDALMFELSRQMGRWAPRTRWAEVYFCPAPGDSVSTNHYIGLYQVEEKIKVCDERLDIATLETADVSPPDLGGGYLFKIDHADPDEFKWRTARGIPTGDSLAYLCIVEPKLTNLAPAQVSYLTNLVQDFENALYGANFRDPVAGYAPYLDVGAWIDHHWIYCFSKNPDAFRLSAYMYKDRGGPINAGPAWDFDRSLDSYDSRDDAWNTWLPPSGTDYFKYGWWGRLFEDPDFRQRHTDRWQDLRRSTLATTNIHALIAGFAAHIGTNAPYRDAVRWTNFPAAARGGNYPGEVNWIKNWTSNRASWIDAQYTAPPSLAPATSVVASGSLFSASGGGGTIYVTLDGSDPRLAGGGVNPAASAYAGPVAVTQTAFVVARSLNGTNWSSAVRSLYLVDEAFAAPGDLAISELHYRPLAPTAAERAAAPGTLPSAFEFLEIRNAGPRRVNLYECALPDGQPAAALKLDAVTLEPGQSAVVAANRRAFHARYGTNAAIRIAGEWGDGELADGGERITLLARDGAPIQSFKFKDSGAWPGRADGRGSSLEYASPDFSPAAVSNGANWRASSEIHGTPGADGAGPDNRVVVNEVLAHTDLPWVDAIELFNTTPTNIALGGWYLGDVRNPETEDDYRQFALPSNAVVAAGGFLVFDATDFDPNGPWNPAAGTPAPWEFGLDAARGDDVWLIESDAAGRPRRFVDHVEFGATLNGVTLGRHPDGSGSLRRLAFQTLADGGSTNVPRAKLGAANAPATAGPVVVGEVNRVPKRPEQAPFIELWNAGATNENLAHWTLRGDIDIDFTNGPALAPGERAVLVPFDPANAALSNAFVAAYHATGAPLMIGPWPTGEVFKADGRLILYRADEPPLEEPGFFPQATEDEAAYTNAPAWPDHPAGAGRSLNRGGPTTPGLLPSHWYADAPSPGAAGPRFDAWADAFGAGGLTGDDDGDLAPNLLEYACGGNPLVPDADRSALAIESGGAVPRAVFGQSTTHPGATLSLEQSTNLLSGWTAVPSVVVSNAPDRLFRRFDLPVTNGIPQLFLRLKADTIP